MGHSESHPMWVRRLALRLGGRLVCLTLGCLALGCLTLGCSPASAPQSSGTETAGTGPKTGPLRLAVIPKGTSHQFWRSVHAGADAAAKELGNVEVLWKGPETESDTMGQISVVKNFVTSRVDGIVLAPNHSHALVDAVSESVAEGIPVVIFDSGLAPGPEIVSYVATNNLRGGQLAAQRMSEALDGKGKVILLRYKEGSESTEQRERGFLEEIAKHPGIEVLSSDQYAGTTTQEAMEKATQLLTRYRDDVNGIFAVCEPNCNGVLEALVQAGLAGKVKFVAFDSSETLIKGLGEQTVSGIVLQDPYEMGRQSVLTLTRKLRGEAIEPVIDTGEYVATAENQQTDPINRLLRPEQFGGQ